MLGWTAEGALPDDRRAILIGHPHTSSWDFLFAILGTWALGVDMKFIGKKSLFVGPFGGLFRWLGGTPVDRDQASDVVTQIAERFAGGGPLVIGLSPSGTRKAGSHWRSGFYHMARAAGVPVAAGYIDFATRSVGLGDMVELTGDMGQDMDRIRAAYAGKVGRNPERQIPIRLKSEA
jgi:1-acyl-sn-glycerol-3-phosphate acyltransferase